MANWRQIGMFGQAFPGIDHGTPVGQPTQTRSWGIPTMSGYKDRTWKWNALLPPFLIAGMELVRRLLERIS